MTQFAYLEHLNDKSGDFYLWLIYDVTYPFIERLQNWTTDLYQV